ncbi:MAG: hypothetical protein CMA63_08080 [Euryarchaeota archaeon]|nr:hypothetical protein [Euryarchaeota archaeon]|tara:strand:- start:18076 stop:18933 length:858 start_codon:yes stop_codon:yes gene_type:complete
MKPQKKVGIIGYGFVGKALKHGLNSKVKTFEVDPTLGTSIPDLKKFSPDIIFICVPTPMNDDSSQDISIVESVFSEILINNFSSIIVLKSTVLPNHISHLENKVKNFVYNPEFLTERNANDDFIDSDLIIFGSNSDNAKDELSNFYREYTNCVSKDYVQTDAITASFVKYSINSFLASKVIFFNELKQLFSEIGSEDSWESFISYVSRDDRIGSSHMSVPGPDGKKGFGGACFPKDTNALLNFAKSKKIELSLLNKVIQVNNDIRQKYNEDEREKSQNIRFKNKS